MASATPGFGGVDIFNLGSNFEPQSGDNGSTSQDVAEVLDENGDLVGGCTNIHSQMLNYSATYFYCGSDLDTDFTLKIGQVIDNGSVDILITAIDINFSNDQVPEIVMTGKNSVGGNSLEPATTGNFDGYNMDLTTIIGNSVGGIGIPTIFTNSNANADEQSAGLSYTLNEVTTFDSSGVHFATNVNDGRVTASISYIGVPTLTTTGWTISDPLTQEVGNTEQNSSSITAFKGLARTVAP